MSKAETELLVHITASSTSENDKQYRSFATAYLAFEPVTTTTISSVNLIQDDGPPDVLATLVTAAPSGRSQSPQLSFAGVVRNLKSPDLPSAFNQQPATQSQASQLSWRTPASVVADSNPDNAAAVTQYTSPTRLFEHLLTSPSTPASRSRTSGTESQQVVAGSASGRIQLRDTVPQPQSQVGRSPEATASQRSQHQSLPHRSSQRSTCQSDAGVQNDAAGNEILVCEDELRATDLVPSSELQSPPRFTIRAESEPPEPARRQVDRVSVASRSLTRSSSDSAVVNRPASPPARQREVEADETLTLTVMHAPSPPVSCADLIPDDLLTPNLRHLVGTIGKKYKPESTIRSLEQLERGYWLLDCSEWTAEQWKTCWFSLTKYIKDGKAGWGVWCSRDQDFRWLRVYSWGSLAKHTYLVLYLTTLRQVSSTRTQWVDGQGRTCIVMKVHGQ
jgi:hypothetical protein